MSFQAIYDVTRSLRVLLHSQLLHQNSAAHVTLLPPGDKLPETLGINLYLYRAVESPFTRNRAWPGDRVTPATDRPALGLQLLYLLTPLGAAKPDENSDPASGDDAHTMLGVAMQTLQEHPVLNDVHLPDFDADQVLPDYLLNSYEQIKVHLAPISLEELSKIWATINQPYRLSVAYEVSLVELTPTPPPAVNGGIVTFTGVNVVTLAAPRLQALLPPTGPLVTTAGGPIIASTLQVTGFGLSLPGARPKVQFGGRPATIHSSPPPTDTALTAALPTSVEGGPQVDLRVSLADRTSDPLPFIVTPWLTRVTPLRTDLATAPTQITLSGSGFTTTPQTVRLDGPGGAPVIVSTDTGTTDSLATATLPASLANGRYSIRFVLNDAAQSASNDRTLEVIPRLDPAVGVSTVSGTSGPVHQLTINGARLADPRDVRLLIDDVEYLTGAQANPSQIVYTLGRLLSTGLHELAVNVGGSLSHSVTVSV